MVAATSAVLALSAVLVMAGPASARVSAFTGATEAAHRPACPSAGGPAFEDVPRNNVHGNAIRCVGLWQVAKGRSAGLYAPEAPVTRAQMASFIARLIERSEGRLPAAPRGTFRDLPAGGAHNGAVEALAAAGIVRGTSGGVYAPERTVTRAQMASFLVRAFEYRTGADLPTAADAFADDSRSVHEQSINKAAAAGFTTGRADGRFAPTAAVRRDQMASFVTRVLDRLVLDGVTSAPTPGSLPPSASEPVGDGAMRLCYATEADLSDGRLLQGATVAGTIYLYLARTC